MVRPSVFSPVLEDDNEVEFPYWAQPRGIGGYRCGGSERVLWRAVRAATPPATRRLRLLFFMDKRGAQQFAVVGEGLTSASSFPPEESS